MYQRQANEYERVAIARIKVIGETAIDTGETLKTLSFPSGENIYILYIINYRLSRVRGIYG